MVALTGMEKDETTAQLASYLDIHPTIICTSWVSGMNLLALTFKNLWHRKLRVSITVVGVGLSIAAFVSLIGLADSFKDALLTTYASRETDLLVIEKNVMDIFSSNVGESYLTKIIEIPDVRDASAVLIDFYAFDNSKYVLIYGWKIGSYLFDEIKIEGISPHNPDEVIIGQMAARRLAKKTGETIALRGEEFKVVGVFMSKSVFEEGAIIIPLRSLQRLKARHGKVTMFNVRLKERLASGKEGEPGTKAIQDVGSQICRLSPDLDVRDIQGFVSSDNPLFTIVKFSWAISICAFIIAVLGILNTMTTSVLERMKEIGVVLAIGWSRKRIICMVLVEAVNLSLAGCILGLCIGYIFMKILISAIHLDIPASITPGFCLKSIVISLVIGIISGIYPAIRASSIAPIRVLRHEQ
jgi:putative ABC transport system permease protein